MKGGDVDALSSMEKTLLKKKLAVTGMLAHWQFPHHIALVRGQKRTMNSLLCLRFTSA
jgi:hypothetical protein